MKSQKKNKKIEAPDWMIIDAVRYCIGRRSYQVAVTTDWIIGNWDTLPDHVKNIMRQDLKEAIATDDSMRECGDRYRELGYDIDREAWLRVYGVMNG